MYRNTGIFFSRWSFCCRRPGVTADGGCVDVTDQISFEEEAARGEHISDRVLDWNGEDYVVRHFVPVEQDGGVAAHALRRH